jgi:UDP-galactopyranose mutase
MEAVVDNKDYDFLIVGAGLYGAVFANELKKRGKKCLVIDKRDHIAGNIYTENVIGIQVHRYGAHIFHTSDRQVWDYVNQFADFNNYINAPVARYKDELYNLPFNMNTFHEMWGVVTPDEAKKKIEEQIAELGIKEPQNLEEQALSLVGTDVYTKLIKGYTEKQWGRDCRDLPAFIIRRLPLRFTYNNNYFNDRWQGIPAGGYTALVEKLLEGTEIRLKTDYRSFVTAQPDSVVTAQTGEKAADGQKDFVSAEGEHFERVVYTGMLDEFFTGRLGTLEYRSLRFETRTMTDCDNYQGNAVVNYTERDIPYTRIIEHKHFEFGTQPGTVITKEYPQEWKPGDEPYYPVNDEKNMELFGDYKELADMCGGSVIFGGRLGQYKYYDMDKVIAEAIVTADAV